MSTMGTDGQVDNWRKKEEYRGLDEEQAEIDHLAPS